MYERIKEIALKHGKNSIAEQWNHFVADRQLKIGFVGMFSAGKTSLINSLLGLHLPVNPNPTTKSICVIESTNDAAEYAYFIESGNQRTEVGFMDFQKLLNGEITGTAVVKLPQKPELPEGVIYIDTPGVDNFTAEESDLTYRYLSLLDGAVVCIDGNDGTIRQNVLDFISVPALFALSSRMVFAITHADTKTPVGIESVRQEVIQKIRNFAANNTFDCTGIEDRVVTVNANDHDSAIQVVEKIEELIVTRKQAIWQQRLDDQTKGLAKQLALLLQDELDNLKCDTSELDRKKQQIENAIQQIENEIVKRSEKLEDLDEKLAGQIKNILLQHELEISQAASDEAMTAVFMKINREIGETAKALVQARLGDFNIPAIGDSVGADLMIKLKRIDFTRDLGVQIATAVLTAYVFPASGFANVAEGAGGAAAQAIGKSANAASKAGKAAGKAAQAVGKAGKAAGKAGKAAGKAARAAGKAGKAAAGNSTFKKILQGVGKILHDINPLEMVGDWVALELKHNTYTSMANTKSIQIAGNILEQLEEPFETQIIIPLRERCEEQKNSLVELIRAKKQGITDFSDKRKEIQNDIDELNCI